MNATRLKWTGKTVLLPLIGIVALILYVLFSNVNFFEVVTILQTANPLIYSVAIFLGLAEVFFYALSWRALLSALKVKISTMRSFLYTWYSIFMDIVVPAESISSDLCRVYLVNKEQNGLSGKTVASVVMQRILGMTINVIILLLGITFLYTTTAKIDPMILTLSILFIVAITSSTCVLLVISWKETWGTKIINYLIHAGELICRGRWQQKFDYLKQEALSATKIFHDSMKEFGHKPKTLILPTFLLLLNWFSGLAVPYVVFFSLGYPVSWTVIFVTCSIVLVVKSIPIGVPEVGAPEIIMISTFQAMSIPEGISIAVTMLSRLISLWLRVGVGFAAQQWVELKLPREVQHKPLYNPMAKAPNL
ncbi:MAG: flippase-like domain-containing protein [Candidatus Bathyarchaeota archaeon]|nr:flippase-like domain-containing protein [Candidatus Bathyarchaeota archaeon]